MSRAPHIKKMRENSEVLKIVQSVDVTTQIKTPSSRCTVADHVKAHLEQMRGGLTLTDSDEREFLKALKVIDGLYCSDDDDDEDTTLVKTSTCLLQ